LKRSGKVVGFLGDGINDAPSLRASDVGISVDNACDIAKEAADLILLKKDLLVLRNGIEEGRKTYANIIKYILLGTSSDFGNMFSLTISSLFLPFLPMLPTQILLNDLLYDVTQLAIPSDNVDRDLLQKPPKWNIAFIRKFMLVFGPISSLFDFLTFGVLLLVFRGSSSLFQTGWFIESIISQSLIVLSIRTSKVPFYRSRPSSLLLSIIMLVVAIGIFLPLTFMGKYFSFSSPPLFFYILLAPITLLYFFTVEQVKGLFFRRVLSPFAENPGRK
jgi:Mg2+-importing ATPase